MRKHHELKVWQEAMQLVEEVYKVTAGFPQHEQYGLAAQLRRAAVSVPSNIACPVE
jgi:four helix bundle protein